MVSDVVHLSRVMIKSTDGIMLELQPGAKILLLRIAARHTSVRNKTHLPPPLHSKLFFYVLSMVLHSSNFNKGRRGITSTRSLALGCEHFCNWLWFARDHKQHFKHTTFAVPRFFVDTCHVILNPVVEKLDNAIHRINRYPVDKYYEN